MTRIREPVTAGAAAARASTALAQGPRWRNKVPWENCAEWAPTPTWPLDAMWKAVPWWSLWASPGLHTQQVDAYS